MGWGSGNIGGGGAQLNFAVKRYSTEAEMLAATPKENTIGVISEVDITSYVFSAAAPDASEEGTVWFLTGTSSAIEFNALKKNALWVYPISAKQSVGGDLVDVPVMIYQNGAWESWVTILFANGTLAENYGALGNPNKYNSANHTTRCETLVSVEAGELKVTWKPNATGQYISPICYFELPFDFSNFSEIELTAGEMTNLESATLSVFDQPRDQFERIAEVAFSPNGSVKLDVSEVNRIYYLGVRCYSASSKSVHSITIKDWRMLP